MKARRTPFKNGHPRGETLELIHGDLVGPILVESVSKEKSGFVLMHDSSRPSWVLPLKAKSDAPIEFERWDNLTENGIGRNVKTVYVRQRKGAGSREECRKWATSAGFALYHRYPTHHHHTASQDDSSESQRVAVGGSNGNLDVPAEPDAKWRQNAV